MAWVYLRRSLVNIMEVLEGWSSTQPHVLASHTQTNMMCKETSIQKRTTISKGFLIYSISYFLSKHAVVNITRQFGSSKSVYKTGIKVQHQIILYHCQPLCHQHVALCPWFVETAIVDDQTKKLVLEKSPLKFTTVERVGEAFELAVKEQRWEEIKSIEGFFVSTAYWRGNNSLYLWKEQEIKIVEEV